MNKIFLIQTEEGNIVNNITDFEVLKSDIIITENEITELVDIELDQNCHNDYLKDYENKLEFYLCNVVVSSYPDFIQGKFDDRELNQKALEAIQEEVVEKIIERYSDINF